MEKQPTASKTDLLTDSEVEWMVSQRPLIHSEKQLAVDYGEQEAKTMIKQFEEAKLKKFLPCLAWPGLATRWKQFLAWLIQIDEQKRSSFSEKEALKQFGIHLGRVVSYRALAITDEQYGSIVSQNAIVPSGRLKTDAKILRDLVNRVGVKHVCYARLYIGLGLLPFDPSLSLHDDGETAVCIASGYMKLPTKRVHLMKLSVPLVEVLGYTVAEVQDPENAAVWFEHRGIWFDSRLERTERYTLYEIPWYKERLLELKIFNSKQEIVAYLQSFKDAQLAKKESEEKLS